MDDGCYERPAITELDSYRSLFRDVTTEIAIGEASTGYLVIQGVAESIRQTIPEARLIAILRNPVERAYSHFLMNVRDGLEFITDFSEALQNDENDKVNGKQKMKRYIEIGFYYEQLNRYFKNFLREHIKVYIYDDFLSNPDGLVQDTFRFLSVDDNYLIDMSYKPNVSGIPTQRTLHGLVFKPNVVKSIARLLQPGYASRISTILVGQINRKLYKPSLSLDVRSSLVNLYRGDILKLQDLIDRDLPKWLEVSNKSLEEGYSL